MVVVAAAEFVAESVAVSVGGSVACLQLVAAFVAAVAGSASVA